MSWSTKNRPWGLVQIARTDIRAEEEKSLAAAILAEFPDMTRGAALREASRIVATRPYIPQEQT